MGVTNNAGEASRYSGVPLAGDMVTNYVFNVSLKTECEGQVVFRDRQLSHRYRERLHLTVTLD